jgi:hypothetical protein
MSPADTPGSVEEEISALRQRAEVLTALAYEGHACDDNLVIRQRTFAGGASHIVRQCTICGQQRGGPVPKREAERLLAGAAAAPFEHQAEERHRQARIARVHEQQRIARRLMELENPEAAELDATERAEHEAALERARTAIATAVESVMVLPAPSRERFLLAELFRHRGTYRDAQAGDAAAVPFESEEEVTAWLNGWIEQDFDVWREVPGVHLAEKVGVRVDLVLRAKPHVLAAGFAPCFFGVEIKHLPTSGGFSPKASRAVRQAMSYMDCEFDLNGEKIRLQRVLLFTNMSFEAERAMLRGVEPQALSNDQAKWAALLELANHGNVGNLEIYGSREAWKGWRIAFATGKYFSRYLKEYRLSDANLFAKVRIGNF